MPSQQQRQHVNAQATQQVDGLLDQAIKLTPVQANVRKVTMALGSRGEEIERLLPDFMKGQSERLVARARMSFAKSDQLQKCTPESFIKCVLEAAELGFAIDGRMCYAVPFNNSVKVDDGRGGYRWEKITEATLIVSYMGLVAVAKRLRTVQDVRSYIVLRQDHFDFNDEDGKDHYSYKPDLSASRDTFNEQDVLGVLTVATHAEGWHRSEFMPWVDVARVRNTSKGYSADNKKCPWVAHPGEMARKTGIRRILKTFSDDPGLIRAMEVDEGAELSLDDIIAETDRRVRRGRPVANVPAVTDTTINDEDSDEDSRTITPSQPSQPASQPSRPAQPAHQPSQPSSQPSQPASPTGNGNGRSTRQRRSRASSINAALGTDAPPKPQTSTTAPPMSIEELFEAENPTADDSDDNGNGRHDGQLFD